MDRHERETVFSAVIKSVGIRFACKGFVESIIVEVEIFLFSRKQSHFQILHLDSKFQLPLDCYLEVLFRFLERSPVSSEIHFQCQGTALAIFKKSQNSERELCRCLILLQCAPPPPYDEEVAAGRNGHLLSRGYQW